MLDRHAGLVPIDLVVGDYPGIWASLERLTVGRILAVLREGRVFAVPGETLGVDDVLARCGIVQAHRRLTERWLDRLARAGLLTQHRRSLHRRGRRCPRPIWKRFGAMRRHG